MELAELCRPACERASASCRRSGSCRDVLNDLRMHAAGVERLVLCLPPSLASFATATSQRTDRLPMQHEPGATARQDLGFD